MSRVALPLLLPLVNVLLFDWILCVMKSELLGKVPVYPLHTLCCDHNHLEHIALHKRNSAQTRMHGNTLRMKLLFIMETSLLLFRSLRPILYMDMSSFAQCHHTRMDTCCCHELKYSNAIIYLVTGIFPWGHWQFTEHRWGAELVCDRWEGRYYGDGEACYDGCHRG